MTKILIGWLAKNNDFIQIEGQGTEVNKKSSPNYQFHQHFFKHDRHLILHTPQDKILAGMLHTAIKKDFKDHAVELVEVNIIDPISLTEIKPKVENVLMKIREHEVDIFFSPGTSIMQVSWFICHTSMGLNSRLIQTRSGRFTKSGEPEMSEIGVEKSNIPYSAVLREESEEGRRGDSFPEDIYHTETIRKVYDRAYKIAQTDKVTCLINGASRVSKLAKA
ncbi:MAG: RNA repair transcriptional activator RtcR family protein [Bacteroidota bacterium]